MNTYTLADWTVTIKNNRTGETESIDVRTHDEQSASREVGMQLLMGRHAEVGDYTQIDIRPKD
jgi:hypothetical protein